MVSPPVVKYYPCAVHQGEETLESLSEFVAMSSSMTVGDCYGVILNLTHAISDALAQGRIVKIDTLGSFQLTIKGTAADSPEPLGKNNINGVNVIYKPSKNFKKRLKTVDFKRVR